MYMFMVAVFCNRQGKRGHTTHDFHFNLGTSYH